jgi:hypothetical protein
MSPQNSGEKNKKNVERGPFDLAGRLLNASHAHSMTIEDRLEIYFSDYQLMPAFVQVPVPFIYIYI